MVVEAHSTSTLINGPVVVLVDTSSRQYRGRLMDGLDRLHVRPDEVDVVVSTHLHPDHVGNHDLFPRARKLARREERPGDGYEVITADIELAPGIALLHTPGHTRGSMSVIVDAGGARYVIAGDALPTRDNHDRWVPPGVNYDPAVALDSMRRIVSAADVIIPGHGAPFEVSRDERKA